MQNPLRRSPQSNALSKFGPLYHEYSFFGEHNQQIPGIFSENQKSKTPTIIAYMALAFANSKTSKDKPSFAELFCADGYYAMIATRLGAKKSVGYDNNFDEHQYFNKAQRVAETLGLKNVSFVNHDMQNIKKLPKYDIVANIGGLYHVKNPEQILQESYDMAKSFLIIQTVVSLDNNKKNYFQSPAPGQDWGSRYSRESFEALIKKLQYKVIASHFNELQGNKTLSDRGSVYFLIEK